jgi:hypothetical protein
MRTARIKAGTVLPKGSTMELIGFDIRTNVPTLARLLLDGEVLLDITYSHDGTSVIDVEVPTGAHRVPVYVQSAAVIEGSLMIASQFHAQKGDPFSEIQFT